MILKNSILFGASLLLATSFTSCGDDDEKVIPTTFTVTVENISTSQTVATERADGIVPLSPPAFALFTEDDPMFEVGEKANLATERIAEDGAFAEMEARLLAAENVQTSAAVPSPGGPDNGGALFNGESSSFTFTANTEDDKLQFMTMMVQSNDWFYSFQEGGIELFSEEGTPISGDITSMVRLYDAGTEEDTQPGSGPDQKPVQDPAALDQGPKEDENIESATSRHNSFVIPSNASVIRVTISS